MIHITIDQRKATEEEIALVGGLFSKEVGTKLRENNVHVEKLSHDVRDFFKPTSTILDEERVSFYSFNTTKSVSLKLETLAKSNAISFFTNGENVQDYENFLEYGFSSGLECREYFKGIPESTIQRRVSAEYHLLHKQYVEAIEISIGTVEVSKK